MPSPIAAPFFLVTCEHGGCRIPAAYRGLFSGHADWLTTHRGMDFGALLMARELADALAAPLVASTVSRLLIDLNRSKRHPALYSEATRSAPAPVREEIFRRYYLPYRSRVERIVTDAVAAGARVIHVSCHSFTPELGGEVRNADVGLLYDPARLPEAQLCRRWRQALAAAAAIPLKVRMNYPYAGSADGLTTHLRRRFPQQCYLGIELEINQKLVLRGGRGWTALRRRLIAGLRDAEPAAGAMRCA